MVKTVKLDKKDNYLINTKTGDIVEKYNPEDNDDLELVISLDNSKLKIQGSMIKTEYGGQVVVMYGDDKFIIDDGYQDILIKAGYIVYLDYDTRKDINKRDGNLLRISILNEIEDNMAKLASKYNENYDDIMMISKYIINGSITATIETPTHTYTVVVNTIDDIVSKNNRRKENSLSYYPFDKNMDKYGSVYLSIFAKKKGKEKDKNLKYRFAMSFIAELVSMLDNNQYHYVNQDIRRRIINWNNM